MSRNRQLDRAYTEKPTALSPGARNFLGKIIRETAPYPTQIETIRGLGKVSIGFLEIEYYEPLRLSWATFRPGSRCVGYAVLAQNVYWASNDIIRTHAVHLQTKGSAPVDVSYARAMSYTREQEETDLPSIVTGTVLPGLINATANRNPTIASIHEAHLKYAYDILTHEKSEIASLFKSQDQSQAS